MMNGAEMDSWPGLAETL